MQTIMIVEDDPSNRELLVQLLEDKYQTLQAVDGKQAVELAQAELPDLILMDLALPEVDGWQATRLIKANKLTRRIPVIALTAHAMVSHRLSALESGCDAYLIKPIEENALFRRIEMLLETSGPPT